MQRREHSIGDTVRVVTLDRTPDGRVSARRFEGVLLSRRAFTVRRTVDGEGVERTFPCEGPDVISVEVLRTAKARRAKLNFLRQRSGKAARLPGRRVASPGKRKRRRRGAKAKAERRARQAAAQRKPPDAGATGVLARLRPTDPPRLPPRPKRARRRIE